ncbi:hypothetical protein [Micromonospora saelicesensis]|uniref:hypothetical protein n=1 Tax=Micromonospora saelicesensis TaxID=285676 RepID=UPI0015EC151C|nr:hypothetical protein [Micromonospora saelicesensis]
MRDRRLLAGARAGGDGSWRGGSSPAAKQVQEGGVDVGVLAGRHGGGLGRWRPAGNRPGGLEHADGTVAGRRHQRGVEGNLVFVLGVVE